MWSLVSKILRPASPKDLEQEITRLAAIVESSPDAIVGCDLGGIITSWNPAAERLYGYSKKEIIGRKATILSSREISQEEALRRIRQFYSTCEVMTVDNVHKHKSGKELPVSVTLAPIFIKNEAVGASLIVRDISERKRTEAQTSEFVKALEFKTIELERSNQELDDFAYAASHDLKSPLRAIDNLARWIIEDVGDVLPSQSRKDLDILRSRVTRMESLLSGLLQYSRIGKFQEKMAPVDCGQMVKGILDIIERPGQIKFLVAPNLPSFTTYKMPLEMVLRNLLQNSIAHHDSTDGQVSISSYENSSHYIFEIADDGPGIPNEYKDIVFKMFKTLKPKDQGASNGVGLALVKKTVENLRGAITLTDNSPKGCRFRVHWPKSY